MPQFNRDPVPDRPTLAKRLDGAGFHSILITSNGWLVDDTNADYGYTYSEHPAPNLATTIYEIGRDKLLEDISNGGVQRWFLHLHFKEPHVPYEPPSSYLGGLDSLSPVDVDFGDDDEHYDVIGDWESFNKDYRDLVLQHMKVRYKGEMQYMDDLMLDIWSDLQVRGLLEDTLVVFWSDHGEQFFEHGHQTHAYSLYSEENDAIGLFWSKNIIPAAWDGPTSNIDIVPTLLGLYGLTIPSDMSGMIVGSAPDDRPIHSAAVARIGTVQSVVMGDYKLHYQWNNGEKLLFDLANDPGETENIYDAKDPTVIALWNELLPRVEALDEIISVSPIDPGP